MSFTSLTRPSLKLTIPTTTQAHRLTADHPAQSFDPTTDTYGHGTTRPSDQKKSILHPDLKTIPHQPQVQLIGNGLVDEWEGLTNVRF
jgi:hypothetical protein